MNHINHIQQALETLKTNFPDKWWIRYDFDKEKANSSSLEKNITDFRKQLIVWRDEIFDDFNLSILKGEYVKYSDSIKQIKEVEEYLTTLQPADFFPDQDVQDLILFGEFQKEFINPLESAINFFAEFIGIVNSKLAISNKEYIRYNDDTSRAIQENRFSDSAFLGLNLLEANIRIAELDHFLEVEGDNILRFLIWISFQLEDRLNIRKYALLIKKKCDFLKSKLLLRRRHERDNKPLYSIINSSEKEITVSEFKDGGSFDTWLDYLDVHYEMMKGWETVISADYIFIKNKEIEDLSVKELCRLIKFHKDVETSFPSSVEAINKIRRLINKYLDDAKKSHSSFDIFSYQIALNYAINNEFSIICDSKNNVTIEKATELYNEIIAIQRETGIKDFFPQTKFLNFLLGKLKVKYHEKKALETIDDCRFIIDKCHEIYEVYKSNVEWSRLYYNYVFQLPFEECLLKLKDEEVIEEVSQLFVSSTFLMPLPKQKYISDFENDKREVTLLESSIKAFENIKSELEEVKKVKATVETISNDFKSKETRTVEILGIFAALISFVAASLPTFKIIETPLQAAMFMLALSTSLCAFIVVLLAASRGLKTFTEHRKTIWGSVILASLFWCLLIGISYCPPISKMINHQRTEINAHREIDTITNNNNKIIVTIKRDTSKMVTIEDSSKVK